MKKEDVPQDLGALGKVTKEVCYATDESGNYITSLSLGWDVKKTALDATWQEVEQRAIAARAKVKNNEASPLLFFLERSMMDITILSQYTGFWKWQVRRHLRPSVFQKLSESKLKRYADVFNVSVAELKTMSPDGN